MRTDRIYEIDLACIAPLPVEMKREALRKLKSFVPPLTFQPIRNTVQDLFDVRPNPFIAHQTTAWNHIEERIDSLSKTDAEAAANICAGAGLYRYRQENAIHGVAHQFTRMSLGHGTLSYWSDVLLGIGDRHVIPFLDPRISGGLTPLGIRFVFSAMDLHLRRRNIQFRDYTLAIIRLSPPSYGRRNAIVHFDDGIDLFLYQEMKQMVRDTYDIWAEVLQERAKETRPKDKKKVNGQMELNFLPPPPVRKAS